MTIRLARRRFVQVVAMAGGGAFVPEPAAAAMDVPPLWVWRGRALGSAATIRLHHPDATAARGLLERCAVEMRRLEKVFSLYRRDSALCLLNAEGYLHAPPLDLVRLLGKAVWFGRQTGGAFDVTVQPLWERYAAHDWSEPAPPPVADLLPLVDWQGIDIETRRIALCRSGMAVTLNGIAQGYITDRITELLRDAGCRSVLTELGEIRGLGPPPDGRPWRIGLEGTARVLTIANGAVATSSAGGTVFEPSGAANHLFDPRTGRSTEAGRSVTVSAADATTADALSTALSVVEPEAWPALLAAIPGARVETSGNLATAAGLG